MRQWCSRLIVCSDRSCKNNTLTSDPAGLFPRRAQIICRAFFGCQLPGTNLQKEEERVKHVPRIHCGPVLKERMILISNGESERTSTKTHALEPHEKYTQ